MFTLERVIETAAQSSHHFSKYDAIHYFLSANFNIGRLLSPIMSKLDEYLQQPVSNLVAESPREIGVEEADRHRIYSSLLMSIHPWNHALNVLAS